MVGGIGLACGHAGHRPETSVTKLQCIDLQPSTQPWIFNLHLSTQEADDTLFRHGLTLVQSSCPLLSRALSTLSFVTFLKIFQFQNGGGGDPWMDHATDTLAAFFVCPSCPMGELNNVRANSQAKSNYVGICGQLIWLHAKGSKK